MVYCSYNFEAKNAFHQFWNKAGTLQNVYKVRHCEYFTDAMLRTSRIKAINLLIGKYTGLNRMFFSKNGQTFFYSSINKIPQKSKAITGL